MAEWSSVLQCSGNALINYKDCVIMQISFVEQLGVAAYSGTLGKTRTGELILGFYKGLNQD